MPVLFAADHRAVFKARFPIEIELKN